MPEEYVLIGKRYYTRAFLMDALKFVAALQAHPGVSDPQDVLAPLEGFIDHVLSCTVSEQMEQRLQGILQAVELADGLLDSGSTFAARTMLLGVMTQLDTLLKEDFS